MNTIPFIDIHTHSHRQPNAIYNLLPNENLDKFKNVEMFSIGWHPWYLNRDLEEDILQKIESIVNHPNIVALGEIGLDKLCDIPFNYQEEIFRKQILLSELVKKPLIIHCVKAFNELMEIKKQIRPNMIWIVHGFNNKPEMALQLIRSGIKLSFGKALLNELSNASNVIKQLNTSDFFLETDDSTDSIEEIYEKAAFYRNTNLDALKEQMYENFRTLFKK